MVNPTANIRVPDQTKLLKAKEQTVQDPTTKEETASPDCHESIITDEDEY